LFYLFLFFFVSFYFILKGDTIIYINQSGSVVKFYPETNQYFFLKYESDNQYKGSTITSNNFCLFWGLSNNEINIFDLRKLVAFYKPPIKQKKNKTGLTYLISGYILSVPIVFYAAWSIMNKIYKRDEKMISKKLK
jgi:hypothetical protein